MPVNGARRVPGPLLARDTANVRVKKSPDDFSKEDLMKHKSFLFLIAALAMGLALLGCSSDSDSSTDYVYQGFAGDVEDIAAAFDKVNDVYLTRDIEVDGGQTLDIKTGKTLHLNGNNITMKSNSSVIASGVKSIAWSGEERAVVSGKIVVAAGATVFLIGPSGSFPEESLTVPSDATALELLPSTSGSLSYTENDGRAFAATNQRSLVFNETTGDWLPNAGGTKVVYIGNLDIPSTPGGYTIAGSLSVAGDVNLAGTIAGANGELEVLGKLTSKITNAAAVTLVAGKLTARSIETTGGIFAKTVAINAPSLTSLFEGTLSTFTEALTGSGSVHFTKDAKFTTSATLLSDAAFDGDTTFTTASTIEGDASFGGNVTFTVASEIGGDATFTSGKKVTGEVEVAGKLSAGASGTSNTLVLAPGGQIIYGNGVANSFLTGVGTLATLEGAGQLTFGIKSDELAVSGAGSFVIGNVGFTLNGANDNIKVDGTTGVYFSTVGGSIAAETYELGGKIGTLSNSNGAIGGFILSKDGITKASDSGSASLSYALENVADAFFLKIKNGSQATLTGVNVNATSGSISFEPKAILYLATGGSVTAAGGSLAQGGYIVSIESGSLVTVGGENSTTQAAIEAGSAGTVGRSYIHSASNFIPVTGSAATAAGSAATNPSEDATTQGSIGVFAGYN
jgi:hypothetical protein